MLKTCSQRTLQKWFNRSTGASLAWAFETWRSNNKNLHHRDKMLITVRAHMVKHQLKALFARWKQEGSKCAVMEFEEMVMEEDNAMEQ